MLHEEADKDYIRIRGSILGERYKIANVPTPVYEGVHAREADETRANARLIVASPLMLAALERLEKACNEVHEVSGGTPQHEAMWLAQLEARDAITEATGIPWQNP